MENPILNVKNLEKRFGGLVATKDCSFEVRKGEMFGIIGPNGAGKTTLFNALTGFLRADSGEIIFEGHNIRNMKPYDIVNLGASRTFQVMKPYYDMTVKETLRVSRCCKRAREKFSTQAEMEESDRRILDTLSLSGKEKAYVDELTQGELRLLDIGRALATEPEILFLDEPFSGLGTEYSEKLSNLLVELNQSGMTIVIIEHRLRELMQLVTKVMAINFGEVLTKGTPKEVVENPDVVAAYLGKSGGGIINA